MMFAEAEAIVIELIVLLIAAVGAFAYFKKQAADNLPSLATVNTSLKNIVSNAPAYLRDTITMTNDSTYITDAQMRAKAAAQLARKQLIANQVSAQ